MVFISAGVGVTPVLPMLHAVLAAPGGSRRQVGWVQVLRSRSAHALHDEIFTDLSLSLSLSLSTDKPTIRRAIFYNSPGDSTVVQGRDFDFVGRFSVDRVPGEVLYVDDPSTVYYVCGPEGFMRDVGEKCAENAP